MGYYADTVEVDFTIPAAAVPAALEAAKEDFGEDPSLAALLEDWTCIQDSREDSISGFTLGWNGEKYLSRTDDVLNLLGLFANDGSYVRFRGEDDSLFGFRVVDGQVCEESGRYIWSLDPPRT